MLGGSFCGWLSIPSGMSFIRAPNRSLEIHPTPELLLTRRRLTQVARQRSHNRINDAVPRHCPSRSSRILGSKRGRKIGARRSSLLQTQCGCRSAGKNVPPARSRATASGHYTCNLVACRNGPQATTGDRHTSPIGRCHARAMFISPMMSTSVRCGISGSTGERAERPAASRTRESSAV